MAEIPGIKTIINPGSQIITTIDPAPVQVNTTVVQAPEIITTHNTVPQVVSIVQQDKTVLTTTIEGNWDVVWSVNGQTGDVLIDVVLGDFLPNTTYTKGAAITHDGYLYTANANFTSGATFNINDWSMVSWKAPASDISFNKGQSGLDSENVQTALTEIKGILDTKEAHADLATVAETGSLHDLVDYDEFSEVAFSNDYEDLDNLPDLKPVATSGVYSDLTGLPDIPFGAYLLATKEWTYAQWKQYGTAGVSTNFNFAQVYYPISKIKAGDICYINGTVSDKSDCPAMIIARATAKTSDSVTVTAISFWVENTEIIPTKTSDITNDSDFQDGDQVEASVDALETTINTTINKTVMTDISILGTGSTDTLKLDNAKQNILSGQTSSSEVPFPVASASQAGVMNAATFQAVQSNADNINAILNGSVAISNLPASPTDAQLSTAWKNATSLTTVINGAKIADIANEKVWTYYTNTSKWYSATNTTQVVINQWTNQAAGIVKGSTIAGQIFAESDGTGSVNGWDDLVTQSGNNSTAITALQTNKVDKITGKGLSTNDYTTAEKNKLSGIAAGAEVNVQPDYNQNDTSADDFIKNKPTIGNGILTIQRNGTNIDTFSANATSAKNININCVTTDSVIHTEPVEAFITANMIVNHTITGNKLLQGTVGSAEIATESVKDYHIARGNVRYWNLDFTNYSENAELGEWLDGYTLKRKTISFTMPNNEAVEIPHGIMRLESLAWADMRWYDTQNQRWYNNVRYDGSSVYITFCGVDDTNIYVQAMGTDWSSRTQDATITLYYTDNSGQKK